jgi:hypothetical protein
MRAKATVDHATPEIVALADRVVSGIAAYSARAVMGDSEIGVRRESGGQRSPAVPLFIGSRLHGRLSHTGARTYGRT